MQHCFVAIDGMSLIRTVFKANQDPDLGARALATMETAMSTFRRSLRTHSATHAIAVFDHGGETWRHRLFPSYKEARPPMESELRAVLPAFRDQLEEQLGLVSISVPDVEGDDVLGTLATRWEQSSHRGECVIITTDKDMAALVKPRVRVYNIFKREWRDEAWCLKRFGVTNHQLQDFLALMGDDNDGIPGVPRIGQVKAAKLINQYGSLDGVLAAVDEITGDAGKSLRENRSLAVLSRQLVQLKTDLVLGLRWSELSLDSSRC